MALFAPLAVLADELTVANGTGTHAEIPLYGLYADDNYQHTQTIYPATMLTDMQGKQITKLTYYLNSTVSQSFGSTFQVRLGTTTETEFSTGTVNYISVTSNPVYSSTLSVSGTTVVFDFSSNPYTYTGGNLVIDVRLTSLGSGYKSMSFYGESASTNYSVKNKSTSSLPTSTGTAVTFMPKTTFTYEAPASCPKPTNLTYTLVQGNGTVANLSWTAGGDETEWTVEYATNSAFTNPQTKSVSNTPSTQLTNLTPETPYYARVIAVCGANDESEPSAEVTFTPTNSYNTVVNNGTTTNGYAPLYGNYKSSYDQMIYTADQMESAGITGPCTITKIGFNSSSTNQYDRLPVIYICQSDKSSFSSNTDFVSINEFTKVYDYNNHSQWSITAGWNEFVLDTPFDYDGSSNLIIAVHCAIASGYASTSFYTAATTNNQVIYAYNDSNNPDPNTYEGNWGSYNSRGVMKNLPSLQLYYTPVTVTCPKPTGLTVRANSLTAHGVTMDWDAEAGDVFNYAIELGTGIDPETVTYAGSITATTTTCSMTWNNLLADRDYTVFIRKDCGNGDYSVAATKIIHTEIACPAPTGLAGASDGLNAIINWADTGASSYDIVYSTDASADPDNLNIDGSSNTNSYTKNNLAIDNDYYFWVRANCGGEGYSTWAGPVSVHIGYCVPAPSSVDYNGITNLTFGTGDYVVNNNSNHPTSAPYYADFSSQIGGVEAGVESQIVITYSTGSYDYQTYVWVDFDNSLTFDNDEIICSGSSNATLTLTFTVPATTAAGNYRMRIGGADSGMDNGSDPCYTGTYGIFEDYTLRVISVACPAPTDLTATNVTPTTATLGWSGEAENYNVQYRKVAYEQSLFSEDFENGIPSTWTTIDADGDGNNWMALNEVSSVYTSYSGTFSGWAHGGSNAATSPSYANGVGCFDSDQWLISPQVPLQGTLRFYAASTYDDLDAYEVLLSTTGTATSDFTTTLQAMKNAPYALNDGTEDWEEVTIDLSNFSGQGYIAIHHLSNCMYFLVIDDFEIYETVAEDWTPATVENGATSIDIDELDAEAEYEWQVQADCGAEDGVSSWSAITTFTTPSACTTPTELTAEIAGNAAELSWTGFTETYNVQYRQILDPDPTAPATIIFTADAIWSDGSGYQMLLDADATAYAEVYQAGLFGSDCDVESTIYDAFEYKLPNNADPSCTSTNIVAGSSVTIQVPAGTYDFIITNPTPDDRIWIAAGYGNVGGRQDDYVIEGGKIYEFHVYMGSNGYDATDVTISNPTTAWTLVEGVTNPYTLEDLDPSSTYEVQVQGVNCSGNNNTDWSASLTFTTENFSEFTLPIIGYGTGSGGYFLIATPVNNVKPTNVTNMIGENYDLFAFDQNADDGYEWRNYKANAFTHLMSGQGYLYANKQSVDLVFTGTPVEGTEFDVTLVRNDETDWAGYNLVGNPFNQLAYIADGRDFYTMNPGGTKIIPATSNSIEIMEGVFVLASEGVETETMTFTTTEPEGSKGRAMLALDLSQGQGVIDRAIVRFGEGRALPKFQIMGNSSDLYVPVDGSDYAVVYSEGQGEMPVSFKAESNGTYTLSFNAENVEFGYLHLIDNKTGNDVDLLSTPSYSFEASTTDYESRFKLVFATSNAEDSFAFYSNGSFVINNEGAATVQVIDVNGRILSSESINGCADVNVDAAAGVYMIRLVNGENVKVQKIIVK